MSNNNRIDDMERALGHRLEQQLSRTLERMRRWLRIHPDNIARFLFPHVPVVQILEMSQYLEKVARCIEKKMQWQCVECGKDVWAKIKLTETGPTKELRYVRRDAHYCSPACRQKAFRKRKRVTASPSDATAKASRGNGSAATEGGLAVTQVSV
jgi:hypothetical protein